MYQTRYFNLVNGHRNYCNRYNRNNDHSKNNPMKTITLTDFTEMQEVEIYGVKRKYQLGLILERNGTKVEMKVYGNNGHLEIFSKCMDKLGIKYLMT